MSWRLRKKRFRYLLKQITAHPALYMKIYWAWLPGAESFVPRLLPLRRPILIASLPRSGSTWTLRILSADPSVIPFFEPVQGSMRRFRGRWPWFTDEASRRPIHRAFAHRAYHGIPRFRPRIIFEPDRCRLLARPGKRALVKELLLKSIPEYLAQYRPHLVFLRRHPAAVAASWRKTDLFCDQRLELALGHPEFEPLFRGVSLYHGLGRLQGYLLREFQSKIADYGSLHSVSHEELCADPIGEFKRIYTFCGLEWSDIAETRIRELGASDCPACEWYVQHRKTSELPFRIGEGLSGQEFFDVRKGWFEYDLPWYRDDADWQFPQCDA